MPNDMEDMQIMVYTKKRDVYIGFGGGFFSLDYTTVALPVQRQIANALMREGGQSGSVWVERVIVDEEPVADYRANPAVQALAANVLEKTNGKLRLKKTPPSKVPASI